MFPKEEFSDFFDSDEMAEENKASNAIGSKALQLMEKEQSTAQIRELEREIWVLEGILTYSLDRELLVKISKNFAKIDCVPSGYYYPELYAEPIDPMIKEENAIDQDKVVQRIDETKGDGSVV